MHRIITVLIVLTTLLSCGNNEIDNILSTAEVRLDSIPEVALEMLQAVDRNELTSRRLKARHAILYTIALDKNYIDVTDDSIIAPALRYYRYNGNSDIKLLTHYYNGVILLNSGKGEDAMESFVRAERYVKRAENNAAIARLYKAKMSLYSDAYKHDVAVEHGNKAASYFLADGDTLRYLNTINDLAIQYLDMNDSASVGKLLEIQRKNYDRLSLRQKDRYYSIQLHYALNYQTIDDIRNIICCYENEIQESSKMGLIALVYAYIRLEDYSKASQRLIQYKDSGGIKSMAYYWLDAKIQEGLDNHVGALDSYRSYVTCLEQEKQEFFEGDTKFVEERLTAEIHSLKQTLYLIVTIILFVLTVSVFVFLIKKIINRHRQDRMAFIKDRQRLVEDKESAEQLYNALKSEIRQLKKIRADETLDKEIILSVDQRLRVLNMFILAEFSDSFIKVAYMELKKLIEDREHFLISTRNIFQILHPAFMNYLKDQNLTDWEIGCCCLYCIGLNAIEVSEYLNKKAIYNLNSDIRRKLNIPKGKGQIDVFLKNKMSELD